MLFVPERRRSRRAPRAIRARDVPAADLQKEPTKRHETRFDCPTRSFRWIRRRRRLASEHRSERSEQSNTASAASEAIKHRVYDDSMATWEDGPEYAPIERPADFQTPDAPPLNTAEPYLQMAAWAPKSRPAFDHPSVPMAPLSNLVPVQREEPRDPQKPFAVVTSTMTSDSAWGAVHWAAPSGQPVASELLRGGPSTGSAPAAGSLGPAAGASYPPPDQPIALHGPANTGSAPFPAPGTPGWFSPPPYAQQPQSGPTVTARDVIDAATPGLCMCLIIGGLVYVLSPILLCISLGLAGRVKVAAPEIRRAHIFGMVVLAIMAFIGTVMIDTGFSDWWRFVGRWGLLISWILLVGTLGTIYLRLKSQTPRPPTYRPPSR
jgi:hypothetical protein